MAGHQKPQPLQSTAELGTPSPSIVPASMKIGSHKFEQDGLSRLTSRLFLRDIPLEIDQLLVGRPPAMKTEP
jgi:hypothetical protein